MDYKKLRQRKKKGDSPKSKWLNTYADMITLVLVFFILLFSMSQIDVKKFQAVSDSYRDRAIFDLEPSIIPAENPSEKGEENDNQQNSGELDSMPSSEEGKDSSEMNNEEQAEDSLDQVLEEVQQYLSNQGLSDVISANRTERGVVLILQENVLFETGEAEIIEEGKPFLNKIGTLLTQIPNQVKVEGHTDSRPITTYRYPSNWELSGARASSVIRFITNRNELNPSRFQAVGYADTRPKVENSSPENWQKNRRVEIIILEPENNPSQ
ncbi:chemotaxis protein MotB [Salinibacillus kushneri]|uniref:Chemotaxis protein MotB n=1 Tax=Salinibacillus kushneri TaxID=237682 RepID=A0A1I0JCA7_9BACI|nr:flagellar motor protein MotS [Salinibacillus kushneri]SEU07552.1 chemotaxis protein MotB [Salinibacillus kushneri]